MRNIKGVTLNKLEAEIVIDKMTAAAQKMAGDGNGKRTEMSLADSRRPKGRLLLFPGWVYSLVGVAVVAVAAGVAIGTALVYRSRLESLQGRVDVLEQRCADVETAMKKYVDERLRTFRLQQVSRTGSLSIIYRLRNDLYCVEWGVKLYSNQPSVVIG